MTTIVKTDKQTHEQMIARANTQIEVNIREREQLRTRLLSIETELATLESREQARNQLHQTSLSTVASAKLKLSELDAQSLISEGTAAHEDIIKAQKEQVKTLVRVQKDLTILQARANNESVADSARRETLLLEHEQSADRLSSLNAQDDALKQAKASSFDAIGDIEYAEVRSQIDVVKARIAERERQNEEDQAVLCSVVENGAKRLEDWSQHALVVKKEMPHESPLLRILQSELAYIDQIITDAAPVALLSNSGRSFLPAHINPWGWREVFQITGQDLEYAGFGEPKMIATLKERRQGVAYFLEEYKKVAS